MIAVLPTERSHIKLQAQIFPPTSNVSGDRKNAEEEIFLSQDNYTNCRIRRKYKANIHAGGGMSGFLFHHLKLGWKKISTPDLKWD